MRLCSTRGHDDGAAALAAGAGAARREVGLRTLLTLRLSPLLTVGAVNWLCAPQRVGQSVASSQSVAMCAHARSWVLCALSAAAAASLLPLDAEHLHASVGGFAVMNCHLDFPFGNEIPYHLQWDKDVSSKELHVHSTSMTTYSR